MKIKSILRGLALVLACIILHSSFRLWAQGNYTVAERGPDWKVLQKTTVENGTNRIHRYTELATGLNYTNASGQLVESSEQITLLASGGAIANHGRHTVAFPANIYNGVIEVVTPDGRHLKSRPLGISYDDGSNSVFIATLKSAQGYLTSSNTVTYRDAFTGFKADLVCTYRRGGFECDLVFRQQPPTPDEYGLDNSYATLQMVTEFFNTADPEQVPGASDDWFGLQDATLKFGKLTMTRGKAFGFKGTNGVAQTPNARTQIPVYKIWLKSEGRTFLIETVPVMDLAEELDALPLTAKANAPDPRRQNQDPAQTTLLAVGSRLKSFPPAHGLVADTNQIRLAMNDFKSEPGVVLDYNTVVTDTNDFTFAADTTYYISGGVNLGGTTTFEGGAVIKFSSALDGSTFYYDPAVGEGVGVLSCGQIICPANADAPVILTSSDDDSAGQMILGSSHSPSTLGITYLDTRNENWWMQSGVFRNLRFNYANVAVVEPCFVAPVFDNCRFENCTLGFGGYGGGVTFENCLFAGGGGVQIAEIGDGVVLQNVTMADGATVNFPEVVLGYLPGGASYASSLTVANSIVGGLSGIESTLNSLGGAVTDTASVEADAGMFQTAAAAHYYLAPNSPYRNVGTTAIDSGLLAELQTLTTYAPQDGGAPDTNAPDLGYHYPVNEDSDHDGLPDWWEWKYFGSFDQGQKYRYDALYHYWAFDGLDDYDGDGVSNLQEYQNGTDPNKIRFTLISTNDFVNHTNVAVQIRLEGGVPSYYAIFVNQASTTNWLPYVSSNLTVNLGTTDATYNVVVGLKGLPAEATQTWREYEFYKDTRPPVLSITNPALVNAASTVIKPYLQLRGAADEELASLSYDISNAAGLFTNQDVFVNDQFFDTNTMDFTTNYFHAYDVPLMTNGNVLTVRVTDRAGNTATTNFTVVLNYATATNPPVVKILWPQAGLRVSGTNTTLRGTTSDETGAIAATVVNGDGTTNVIEGVIERNGTFWVENVPLNGTNQISIQVTDAAGNVTTTNFAVKPSSIHLQITGTPQGDDLWKGRGLVSGVVSASTAAVTVNGANATVATTANADGTYDWYADDVPIYGSGTAEFNAKATPANSGGIGGSSGGAGNFMTVEMPSTVMITAHGCSQSYTDTVNGPGGGGSYVGSAGSSYSASLIPVVGLGFNLLKYHGTHFNSSTATGGGHTSASERDYWWSESLAGYESWDWTDGVLNDYSTHQDSAPYIPSPLFGDQYGEISGIPGRDISELGWVGTSGGNNAYPPTWVVHFYAKNVQHKWHWDLGGGNTRDASVGVGGNTTVTLFTGGKAGSKRKHLFTVRGSAEDYGASKDGGWSHTPVKPIPKTSIRILGKYADEFGDVRKSLPDNDAVNLGLWCPGIKHYNAGASLVSRECSPVKIRFLDNPHFSWSRKSFSVNSVSI